MQTIRLELIATLLDDLPVGLVIARVPSGEPSYVNRAFWRILGLDPGSDFGDASIVDRAFTRAGAPYPADRLPFARALAAADRVAVDDLVIQRDDGDRVYVRAVATPARDAEAQTEHIIIVFRDITEQVHAQEARKSLEQQLAFAVNHAPILLWMHDRDGTITLSEGAALAGLGFAPGQLVGQSVFDLYGNDTQVLGNIRRALAGESVTSRYEGSAGFTLQTSREPVFGPRGEVTGVIGVATDVSETRRLEEQLFAAQKLEAMGTMASGVAHEFNNILTAIAANSELCQLLLPRDHEARARVDDIAHASERARDLVQHLLTYSRPQAPRRLLFELRPVVEDAARFLRATLPGSLQLDLQCDAELYGGGGRSRAIRTRSTRC
jgi:PAS domain S-box-containing protein